MKTEKRTKKNGIINAIIPAILLQLSAGTCYCFSTYRTEIGQILNKSAHMIGWLFTAIIFLLGVFAAFSGKFVEKDVRNSASLARILLPWGMLTVAIGLTNTNYWECLSGFCVMGMGVGISYISPIKTLALWYSKNKGLATSVSIASFGLSKALFSPIMEQLIKLYGVINMFKVMAIVLFILMSIGHLLLKKPEINKQLIQHKTQTVKQQLQSNPIGFILFIMFFCSITNGLLFIGYEQQILLSCNIKNITWIIIGTAIFNCLGRIVFSALVDKIHNKKAIYTVMAVIGVMSAFLIYESLESQWIGIIIVALFLINAIYGGGFSAIVPILADEYGLQNLSTIHSLELTAWSLGAVASTLILNLFPKFIYVTTFVMILYGVSCVIGLTLLHHTKEE